MFRIRSELPPACARASWPGLRTLTAGPTGPHAQATDQASPLASLSATRQCLGRGSAPHAHSMRPPVTVPVHSGHPQISAPCTASLPQGSLLTGSRGHPTAGPHSTRRTEGSCWGSRPRGPHRAHLPWRSWLIPSASHGHWLLVLSRRTSPCPHQVRPSPGTRGLRACGTSMPSKEARE